MKQRKSGAGALMGRGRSWKEFGMGKWSWIGILWTWSFSLLAVGEGIVKAVDEGCTCVPVVVAQSMRVPAQERWWGWVSTFVCAHLAVYTLANTTMALWELHDLFIFGD